jgi:hypothetical protein
MFCPKCGTTLPEVGDCPSCRKARSKLDVPPPTPNSGSGPPRPGWRELSPLAKAICILVAIAIALPLFALKRELKRELQKWLWPTFVIVNQSGQTIATATVGFHERGGKPAETDIVRFENVPAGSQRSGAPRHIHEQFSVEGRLVDGTRFRGGGTTPGKFRIIIKPRGDLDFDLSAR